MKRNISDDIYTYLLTEIREHRLLPGGILPSESTLCRPFYVSRPTVRKALARLCDGGYVQSRPGVGTYVSSGRAENDFQSSKRIIIGIDGVDFHDEYQYYAPISLGARQAAEEAGAVICLTDLPELVNHPERKVDAFIATRVDQDKFEQARKLQQEGTPVVLINRFPKQMDLAWLSVDFQYETFLVINSLIRNGARRIALIGRQTGNITSAGRTRGWEEAYRANGLEVPHHLAVDFQDFRSNDRTLPEFFRTAGVDVAFVSAGYLLPPVLNALARLGVRLPEDLDVICFDDVENFTETIGVPVSCIRMPLRTMGAQAVEYLIRKIRNPECEKEEQTFRSSLVVNRCKFLLPLSSAAFCRTPVSPDAEPPSLPRRIPG